MRKLSKNLFLAADPDVTVRDVDGGDTQHPEATQGGGAEPPVVLLRSQSLRRSRNRPTVSTAIGTYAYLIRRRIERARVIILMADKSLAEIALDCGLADRAHMTGPAP
jgi:hypothetical protein